MILSEEIMDASIELKRRLHNARAQIKALRLKRKHLRGRVNAAKTELQQAESTLTRCEESLATARALLAAYEKAREEQRVCPANTRPQSLTSLRQWH